MRETLLSLTVMLYSQHVQEDIVSYKFKNQMKLLLK